MPCNLHWPEKLTMYKIQHVEVQELELILKERRLFRSTKVQNSMWDFRSAFKTVIWTCLYRSQLDLNTKITSIWRYRTNEKFRDFLQLGNTVARTKPNDPTHVAWLLMIYCNRRLEKTLKIWSPVTWHERTAGVLLLLWKSDNGLTEVCSQ
jgi:hypothetical protein